MDNVPKCLFLVRNPKKGEKNDQSKEEKVAAALIFINPSDNLQNVRS